MSQNWNQSTGKEAEQWKPGQSGNMGNKPMEQSGADMQRDMSKQMDQSGPDIRQQGADQVEKDAQQSSASRRAMKGVTGQQYRQQEGEQSQ